MSTPFPQSSLDQAARDAAANKPQNILDHWKKRIMQMPGFQKPAPAPTSSQTQTARDAKAGADAIKRLNATSNGASLVGGSVTGAVTAPLILGGSEDASIKWRRLGYSSPEAYQKAVSQNANRERSISSDYAGKFADLRGSVTPGSNQPAASNLGEGASMDAAERDRAGAGYPAGVTRPDDYPVAFVPDSTLKTGGGGGNRDNSRVVPGSGGMVQKGTDMGRSFNDLLTTVNAGQFSSNQLPTTAANLFSGTAPQTQTFYSGADSYTGNGYAEFGGDGSKAFAPSRKTTENDTFSPNSARIEGGSSRKPGGSLAEALADKDGINSYMSNYSSGDRERMARRAFLDTRGSMDALRAKEAVNGVVFAQNKHYISGTSGDDQAIGIDRSQARDISDGRSTAQRLMEAHIAKNKKPAADSTPAEQQAPALLEQGARNGAFQQDKPMFSGSTPAIGGAVEFDSNNSETLPTLGVRKGYKSQLTYKDPSFPNPFS